MNILKMVNMYIDGKGYMRVGFRDNGKLVVILEHRLNALINNTLYDVLKNDIHHKNGMKLDNNPDNLELISHNNHSILHKTGKTHSLETCQKMSKAHIGKTHSLKTRKKISENHVDFSGNKNPRFNSCIPIRKDKNKTCKQGFCWRARPSTKDGNITLSSVNLGKCIKKVEDFINSEENTLGYTSYEVKLE